MIQFVLLTLFYGGVAYLGVGLIGLVFLSLREEKYLPETIKRESQDNERRGLYVQR
jgi:hypothetical protein